MASQSGGCGQGLNNLGSKPESGMVSQSGGCGQGLNNLRSVANFQCKSFHF